MGEAGSSLCFATSARGLFVGISCSTMRFVISKGNVVPVLASTPGKKCNLFPLFKDELIAAVAPDHPWARSRQVSLEQFRNVQLLTYSADPMESDFIRKALLPAGVLPSQTLGMQLTEGMLEFAKAGLGVAVVAQWTVADSFRNGALIPVKIGRSGLHRSWNAVWLRTHPQQAGIDAFAKLLRSQAWRT